MFANWSCTVLKLIINLCNFLISDCKTKTKKFVEQIFEILTVLKPSLGSCAEVPHKIWA